MSSSLFSSKKPQEWCQTLKETCIPLLNYPFSSSLLKKSIDAVLQDILSQFNDMETSNLISSNSIETPFLLFGDINPILLTNLVISFIHLAEREPESGGDEACEDIRAAWRDPDLLRRIKQIERRARMMGDDLLGRFRLVQQEDTICCINEVSKRKKKLEEDHSLKEELEIILKSSKKLRSSVLMSIMEATSDQQGVLFLQALCDMLIAFKDKVCDEDKRDNNALLATFINGQMNVPSYIAILGSMTNKEKKITACMFASAVIGSAGSTFVSSSMKSKGFRRSLKDAAWAALCYFLGGFVLLCMGLLVKDRWVKMGLCIAITSMVIGVAIFFKEKKQEKKSLVKSFTRLFLIVAAISISVGFADLVHRLRASP